MKKILISFLFIIPIIYLSCNEEDNPVDNGRDPDIFTPLKEGAFWVYQYIDSIGELHEYKEEVGVKDDEGFYTIGLSSILIRSGDTVAIYIGFDHRKVTNEGLVYYDIDKQNVVYLLKKPYKKGTTWSVQINELISRNFTIVDEDLTFETPAGIFSGCFMVHSWENDDSTHYFEYLYAPNVGCTKRWNYVLQSYYIP